MDVSLILVLWLYIIGAASTYMDDSDDGFAARLVTAIVWPIIWTLMIGVIASAFIHQQWHEVKNGK